MRVRVRTDVHRQDVHHDGKYGMLNWIFHSADFPYLHFIENYRAQVSDTQIPSPFRGNNRAKFYYSNTEVLGPYWGYI